MLSKKSRTPAQREQSRLNGSQSKGPISIDGKAKSATNRLSHGFCAKQVLLDNEQPADYEAHLAAYIERYQPIDKVEADLVGHLATSMWQIMRNTAIEVALFDIELCNLDDYVSRNYEEIDDLGRIALVFKRANGDNALDLLRRYKASAERSYHRALAALEHLQQNRPPAAPLEPTQPEPETNSAERTQPAPQPVPIEPDSPAIPNPPPAPVTPIRQTDFGL